MAEVVKTGVDDMTPTIVAQMALGALAGNLQLAAIADRNWEPLVAQQGETVQIPIRGAVTAEDKVAGSDVTEQTPATTNVSITLNKHKETTIIFEDVARAFANQDVVRGYAEDAAIAHAEAIEIAGFVEAYTGFTTNDDLGAAGDAWTHPTVTSARKRMRDAKTPRNAGIYLFASTAAMEDLLNLPEYRDSDKLGTSQMTDEAPMEFRRYGVNFIETQYIQSDGGVPHCLALCPKQGLALAMRPLPLPPGGVIAAEFVSGPPEEPAQNLGMRMVYAYRAEKIATQMTLDCLFGWKVIRATFGQIILR
jgi:hypothetical protein